MAWDGNYLDRLEVEAKRRKKNVASCWMGVVGVGISIPVGDV